MEGFILPTQLALLVYGYLVEEGCSSAAESFMETSQYTKDARKYVAKGGFATKLHGLSLTDIIEILGEIVCYVKSLECAQPVSLEETLRQLRFILKLTSPNKENDENPEKPVYLRFTMQQTPARKTPRKSKPLETNPSPKSCKSLSETTSPKGDGSVIIPSSVKVQQQFHVLLENKVLHEKLAENINKAVANKNESLDSILQKKIVETIYSNTEQDPFFQEMLEELVGPAEASSTPEDTEHENDEISSMNIYNTPSEGLVEASDLLMHCRESPMQTNVVEQSSRLASLPIVLTPNAENSAGQNFDKSAVFHSLPSACGPLGIEPLTPLVSSQAGVPPLDVQTVMAISTRSIPVTSQGPPTYVIASSPGTAMLNSLVTPSIVIGTTFSGAAVRFTPTGPTTSRIQHLTTPRHSSPPRAHVRSKIKVFASSTNGPSLPLLLPKPSPPTFPGGVLGQPIFQVPVSHQGNLQSTSSSLQNPLATVSLTPPANAVVPQSVQSKVVKMGVRTRGGKVKSYPGRKKIVQTIGPSTSVLPEIPDSPKIMGSENKVNLVDNNKSLDLTDEKSQEKTVGTTSNDTVTAVGVSPGSSANVVPEDPIPEPVSCVPDSVEETAKPDPEFAKPVVEILSSVEEIIKPDIEISKSAAEVVQFEPTKSAELLCVSTQEMSSQEKIDPATSQSDADPEKSSSSSRNDVPCRTEATPVQGSEPRGKLRKRLSLSTPRRGSHIRTLEFKTPPKNATGPRKSLSSPKNKAPETMRPEMQRMLESVKKSELFKSPPKKDKKAWDADLRVYTTEEDIPTSVGLKRKCSTAKKAGSASKSKGSKSTANNVSGDPKSIEDTSTSVVDTAKSTEKSPEKVETIPKTPEKKLESDEDLVNRIQREVLDVIDEEDVADLSSTNLCVNKSGESGESPKSSPKLVKSPIRSPGTSSVLEIGDIGLSASTIKKLYRRTTSLDENSCTMDSPLSKAPKDNLLSSPSRSQIEASKGNLFASPIRMDVESAKTLTPTLEFQLQLSPSPQQFRTDLGSTPPPKSGILSELRRTPGSGSLEATLIRECRRIENEGVEPARENSNAESLDCATPQVLSSPVTIPSVTACSTDSKAKPFAEKPDNSVLPLNLLLPPIGITPLKTPGKTLLSAPIGITPLKTPGKRTPFAPVEMTPLSKIINEETRLGKCTLLTPTIPPTPDYEELKNLEKHAGDTNSSPSASNVGQKTPQSKTPTSPAVRSKTPSPSKKRPKTPSSSQPKTPVVKLKGKPAEKTPKTRKRKPTKLSKQEMLIAQHLEAAKEIVFGPKKKLQNDIASGPVEEVPQKKKAAPKRKKKVPVKSEVNPEKESMTDVQLPSFKEILERYEKSIISSSSSTEDDCVFNSATPKPQSAQTITSQTPKRKKSNPKKSPKKRSPKEKVVKKKEDSKSKSKKGPRKKAVTVVSTEGTTEKDAAGEKDSEECSPEGKVDLSTPDPCKDRGIATSKSVRSVPTPDVVSKRKQKKASSPVTWVSESSQDVICIRSPKYKFNQELVKDIAVSSSDHAKINVQPVQDSSLHQTYPSIMPFAQSNILLPSVIRCSSPTPNSSNVPAGLLSEPSSLTRKMETFVGPPVDTGLGDPAACADLDNYTKDFVVKIDGIQSSKRICVTPFFPLFEYPLPPSSSPVSPGKLLNDNGQAREDAKNSKERQSRSRSRSRSSNKDEKSPRKPSRNPEKSSKEKAVEESKRLRRGSRSDSSNEGYELQQRPSKSLKEEFAEAKKRRRRRSRSSSSSKDDEVPQRSVKSSKEVVVKKASKGRLQRSSISCSSEDEKSLQKPVRSVKPSKEELFEASNRRRRNSRNSSEDDKSPRKPGRPGKSSKEGLVKYSKGRRRRSRSSCSSEDEKSPSRPVRPVKSWNVSKTKAEEVVESSKRRRRRSSCSSNSENDRSRKRRRTNERRDYILPRHERRERGTFRARGGRTGGHSSPRSSRSSYSHSRSHRYSSSDDDRGLRKPRAKLLPCPRSRERERDRSGSCSKDDEDHRVKKHRHDAKKHRDHSKKRQDDSKKHHSVSKKHQDDEKKHQDDSTRWEDESKYKEPTKDKDSKRSDRRETMRTPTSNHQDKHPSSIEEPCPAERWGSKSANEPLPKPSRKTLDELEDGEISEESRTTIFQFSKSNPHSAAKGASDRLSSPVASESRQKLLKNVNVDKFLSLVHGDAKSPLAKHEELTSLPNRDKLS